LYSALFHGSLFYLCRGSRRVQVEAETQSLQVELDILQAQVAEMQNKTKRMSDSYLDLDLLDAQARNVLGMMRADELLIR